MGTRLISRLGATTLALFFVFAETSTAQMVTPREKAYWDIVSLYSRGDRSAALAAIGGWSDKDLVPLAHSVSDLAKAAQRCRMCEARTRFDALPLRAAMLLHGERDRIERLRKAPTADGEPDCAMEGNGLMSERLAWFAPLQPGGAKFVARFAAATSLHFRAMLCFGHAKAWADAGLKWSPGDAELLLAQGLVHEILATLGGGAPLVVTGLDSKGRSTTMSEDADPQRQLERAASAFEKALIANPQLTQARLRLGRTEWRLKRLPAARDSLTRLVGEATGPILYLAHLFLGRVLEDEGDLEGAIREYGVSVSLEPETQIGTVALAHAFSLRGETDRARETLDGVLSFAGKRKEAEPYWNYLVGFPAAAETLLEALRLESLH